MNEIRKNKEEEREIVSAKFTMPKIEVIVLKVLIIGFALLGAVGIIIGLTRGDFTLCNFFWLSVLFAVCWGLRFFGLKDSKFNVTNKTINGVNSLLLFKKTYRYRLDEIDNIEMEASFLGIHTLVLHFSQGKLSSQRNVNYGIGVLSIRGANVFRISCIENYEEVYDKLSGLLASVKNDKDVAIDIEMRKAEAEDRKAAAFEMVASKLGSTEVQQDDSLTKLERLLKLKENGAITEEEYNKKKEEILKYI